MTVRVLVGFEDGLRPALRRRIPGGATGTERLVRHAARAACAAAGTADADLSVTLLGDDAIAELNDRYLSHQGPTDVLSFPLHAAGERPVGDIYIGIDQALRQAEAHAVDAREEVARLAAHGTLHVLGHDHPEGPARTRSRMWKLQEEVVARVIRTPAATNTRSAGSATTSQNKESVRARGRGPGRARNPY
jgi:probable rRNA maturation factor